MKASDLLRNTCVSTPAIAEAAKDPATMDYLQTCLNLFFSGLYGKIPEEDAETNEAELNVGEGRILARYEARCKLREDIYIIAYFSQENAGDLDYNYTTILYTDEY